MASRQLFLKEMLEAQQSESFDAFVYFEKRLSQVLKVHLNEFPPVHLLKKAEKQMIFDLLWYVCSPQKHPENAISDSELQMITKRYQQIIQEFRIKHEGKSIGLLDYNILVAFYHVLYHKIKPKRRAGKLKQAFAIPSLEGISLLKKVPEYYSGCLILLLSRLNDVRKKYYAFEMKRTDNLGQLNMTLSPMVSVYWVRHESMMIHRSLRSVYKLAMPTCASGIQWLKIHKEKLTDHYKGTQDALPIYIQAHALDRLKERLDIFNQTEVNKILNLNFVLWNDIEHYKGNLLLPVQVCQILVGYFVCDVVDDKFVIRTFRLITHLNTPQGDRLFEYFTRSQSGIKHCQFDRLSLLFDVEDQYVLDLYKKVGFIELFRLKDLNIEVMHEANYKEFLAYIKQADDAEVYAEERDLQELELQSLSFGKLISLLFFNTIGLLFSLVLKMVYSTAHWFKNLNMWHTRVSLEENIHEAADFSNEELIMGKEYDLAHNESKVFEEQVS
ncbi:hypothetical protein EO244_14190 [Ancylomarina salipaludis]|uniref:Uncharacterized protein n=1 Tax=Ancylomarina salipaludis TaxID=2501299 RepID=A0A4Q1JIQ9_9BACT|nr:hypothetical protein [Ancylomarina salipaludis]RXQ89513.1 hypothetical protein EO244_14190 [Ancylomarina salipaludis]